MTFRILVVCTGNVCRSPLAALRLSADFAAARADIEVRSAGTAPLLGAPMTEEAAAIARAWGLDPGAHRARALDAALVSEAGLVLTAERAHRAAVAELVPARVGRVFTLREAGRLVDASWGAAEAMVPADPEAVVARLAATRGTVPPPPSPDDDDVPDPYGRDAAAYDASAALIARAADAAIAAFGAVVAGGIRR